MFTVTYCWSCEKKDGAISEGGFSWARRLFGWIFLGEKFTKIECYHKS